MPRTFTTALQKVSTLHPKSEHRQGKAHPWDLPFAWTSVDGAMSYEFQIAHDPAFLHPILPTDFTTETSLVKDIKVDLKQYWRVRARRSGANFADQLLGAWSDLAIVVTLTPQVELDAPEPGEDVYPWPVDLSWHAVKGARGRARDTCAADVDHRSQHAGALSRPERRPCLARARVRSRSVVRGGRPVRAAGVHHQR